MKVRRVIEEELLDCAREYPVVTVFGPRQSGKTTLVRMAFPDKPYRSLEDPDIRRIAREDPRGFFEGLPDGAILDEVQRLPELLSYLQGMVDADDRPGRFILTGSHQPELHQGISQTLAGRTALLTLLPFSLEELTAYKETWTPFDLGVRGAFPRIHDKKLKPDRFFSAYVQTYIERDVRALVQIHDLDRFQVFLRLLAGRTGQLVNYTALSNDVGVSSTTIKNWVTVLKASFIVFELPPYSGNLRKRLTRSPKIYFTDAGLACYLAGIGDAEQLQRDRLRGGLYENLVILEFLKQRLNKGTSPALCFYRDSHGNEVDLVIRENRVLLPVEIKSASTFVPEYVQGIQRFREAVREPTAPGMVCYSGRETFRFKDTLVLNPFLHPLASKKEGHATKKSKPS